MRRQLPILLVMSTLFGCNRQIETSLGGEALFVNFKGETSTRPALQIETRIAPPSDRPVGMVTRSAISFHDAQIIKQVAGWYAPGDPTDAFVRAILLWPGLLSAPMLGSKTTGGVGMRIRFGDGRFTPSVEAGFQSSLWTHTSQKQMPFDLCVGTWGSFQMSLGDKFGLGMRTTYDLPIYHTLAGFSEGIIGGSVVLTMVTAGKKKQAPEEVPPPPPEAPLLPQPLTEEPETPGEPPQTSPPGPAAPGGHH
jgi:hypothetical protein